MSDLRGSNARAKQELGILYRVVQRMTQQHDVSSLLNDVLDIMESGLLNMDPGTADAEEINAIFRAAHSIKGGSGTFGFMNVSDFTHVMETLLDEMRDNGEGFYQFARRLSQQHHRFFTERSLADEKVAALDETVAESLAEHARLEAEPQVDFDRFLTEYFAQTG